MGYENGLKASTGDISNSGSKTVSNADEMAAHINQLENLISELEAIWKGESNMKFGEQLSSQMKFYRDRQQRFNDMGTALQRGANGLAETEQMNASNASKL